MATLATGSTTLQNSDHTPKLVIKPAGSIRQDKIKTRKTRTKKVSELEATGWDTSLSWSFPRVKKYFGDETRNVCSIQKALYFKTKDGIMHIPDEYSGCSGVIVTMARGPRIEQLLILKHFEPTWLKTDMFLNLIAPFTNTAKSSRFILANTHAKSWGKAKVKSAIEMIDKKVAEVWEKNVTIHMIDMTPLNKPKEVPKESPISTEVVTEKHSPLLKKRNKAILEVNTKVDRTLREDKSLTDTPLMGGFDRPIKAPKEESKEMDLRLDSILENFCENLIKVQSAIQSLDKSLSSLVEDSKKLQKVKKKINQDNVVPKFGSETYINQNGGYKMGIKE